MTISLFLAVLRVGLFFLFFADLIFIFYILKISVKKIVLLAIVLFGIAGLLLCFQQPNLADIFAEFSIYFLISSIVLFFFNFFDADRFRQIIINLCQRLLAKLPTVFPAFIQQAMPLILIVVAIAIFQNLVFSPGFLLAGDLNFPVSNEWLANIFSAWSSLGSYSAINGIGPAAIFYLAPFSLMAFLGFSTVLIEKVLIIFPVIIGIVSAYLFIRFVISSFFSSHQLPSTMSQSIASALGAGFYIFNPWAIARVGHYFHWTAYCFMPLIVWLAWKSIEERRWKYSIIAGLLLSFISFSPHFVSYTGLIIAVVFIYSIVRNLWRRQAKKIFQILFFALIICGVFLGASYVWVAPALFTTASGQMPQPTYTLRLDDLINANQGQNIATILTGVNLGSENGNLIIFSAILSSTLVFMLIILIVKRIRAGITWILISLLVISWLLPLALFFGPTRSWQFILQNQWLEHFTWLFRESARFGGVTMLAYAIILAIFVFGVMKSSRFGARTKKIIVVASICPVFILGGYAYQSTLANQAALSPIPLPEGYGEANRFTQIEEGKNLWVPVQLQAEILPWAPENHPVDNFVNTSSLGPTVGKETAQSRLYSYFINDLYQTSRSPDALLNFFGVKHFYFRKDLIDPDNNVPLLTGNPLIATTDFADVYENNKLSSYHKISPELIRVVGSLDYLNIAGSLLPQTFLDSAITKFIEQDYRDDTTESLATTTVLHDSDLLDAVLANLLKSVTAFAPAEHSFRGDPYFSWAKASVYEPLHGEWHKVLGETVKSQSWDWDFGRGLVYSQTKGDAKGPSFSFQFEASEFSDYQIMVRNFGNTSGGTISIQLDQESPKMINTFSAENKFTWNSVVFSNLSAGRHTVIIQNISGLNAINLVLPIPMYQFQESFSRLSNQINETPPILSRTIHPERGEIDKEISVLKDWNYKLWIRNNPNDSIRINGQRQKLTEGTDGWKSSPDLDFLKGQKVILSDYYSSEEKDEMQIINTFTGENGDYVSNLRHDSISIPLASLQRNPKDKKYKIYSRLVPVQDRIDYTFNFRILPSHLKELKIRINSFKNDDLVDDSGRITKTMVNLSNLAIENTLPIRFSFMPKERIKYIQLEIDFIPTSDESEFNFSPVVYSETEKITEIPDRNLVLIPNHLVANSAVVAEEIISDTGYSKTISINAPGPVYLNWIESYDPLWTAKINGKEQYHFIANGLTNGFLIEGEGERTVNISFEPQRWLNIGLIISGLVYIGLMLLCLPLSQKK